MASDPTLLLVAIAALITALATGLGALPFWFTRDLSGKWLGWSNAIAGGLMLAACHSLIVEGMTFSSERTLIGLIAGLVFILVSNHVLKDQDDIDFAQLRGADARRVFLVLGIMTLHSAAEGIGVGVAYGDGRGLGDFITAAIALHNVPEGIAISLVMIPRGASVLAAAGWSVFSSLPQPLLAVPAFTFVLLFKPILPVGLGLAAGAMIWMVFSELIPEAVEEAGGQSSAFMVTASFIAMLAVQELLL
ncbi:MAG: ZIP family metal transporter [Geminicoccaceae bacterium]